MMEAGVLVSVQENTDVAAARRATVRAAEAAGFGEELSGAAAIAVTEAASNLLKHARRGEILVQRTAGMDGSGLEITALDKGPGSSNVARCFEDGYSTAGSAGTGLGAIGRLSRFCDIYSNNSGTVLVAHFGDEVGVKAGVHLGVVSIPYPHEDVCGDAWAIDYSPARFRIMLADGLGHGLSASQASEAAVREVGEASNVSPVDTIQAAHARLKSTRGSAASLADVHFERGVLEYAGIGNVAGAIVATPGVRRQMISMNGTLGHELHTVHQYEYPLAPGALVILHSDGLSSTWALETYPGLFQRHPSVIAGVLFRDCRRLKDDATVLVVRARDAGAQGNGK